MSACSYIMLSVSYAVLTNCSSWVPAFQASSMHVLVLLFLQLTPIQSVQLHALVYLYTDLSQHA